MSKKITFQNPSSRHLSPLDDKDSARGKIESWAEEDLSKLKALCAEFRIQEGPDMYLFLSLELARLHYPEPKKRGRKNKWTDQLKCIVVVEIERLIEDQGGDKDVSAACKELAKKEPWKTFIEAKEEGTFGATPAEVLRKIYFEKNGDRWSSVTRDAFSYYESQGKTSEWDEFVQEAAKDASM